MISMRVVGDKAVIDDFRTSPARTQKNLQRAIVAAGTATQKTAKQNAAVDTGNMRNLISLTISILKAVIEAEADYSAYVEFGTSRMAAQPFMRPALKVAEREIQKRGLKAVVV